MGDYYEEYTYFDLPSYFADSRKKTHSFDEQGKHLDSCLLHDVAHKITEICTIDKIDASKVQFSVKNGTAHLKGHVSNQKSLDFVVSAIDSLEGIMHIDQQIEVTKP